MRTLHFDPLSDVQFEHFCFDLLIALRFVNVDWRKGTGKSTSPADRGRDIVCQEECEDIDGSKHLDTWFVDCKHFKKGIPPKELQNLLSWAEAERPNVVLFIVSNFLSNPSKDYLEIYKKNNRPPFIIKYWEKPMVEKLARGKNSLLRKHNLTDVPLRSVKQILKAEEEFYEKVWYDRKQLLYQAVKEGRQEVRADILAASKKYAKEVEKQYGKKNLGPFTDYDWGMINGKLSALRWVLGDDWDMLDT
jgi:hypothetical protein